MAQQRLFCSYFFEYLWTPWSDHQASLTFSVETEVWLSPFMFIHAVFPPFLFEIREFLVSYSRSWLINVGIFYFFIFKKPRFVLFLIMCLFVGVCHPRPKTLVPWD